MKMQTARRMPMPPARLVVLGISLAAGIGATVLASGSKPPEIVVAKGPVSTIVVAAGPLEYGTTLTDDNVSEIPWESSIVLEGAFKSGETADFLAGGEYPVPVVSPGNGGLSTVTIVYKEFGVKLSFAPTVLARGVISLKLTPEVSELDFAHAVAISGTLIPALTTRRARTTVELRDGQSFAIAGLLQDDATRLQDQLPWLGSVPVLGALFRSSSYQANETELVVLVTPYLIKPVPPAKMLKTPLDTSLAGNDVDYFLNGQPEVPKTPPFTSNPFSGLQSLFGGIEPGPPVPAPVVPVPVPVPVPAPVPQVDGALHYDPANFLRFMSICLYDAMSI